MATKSITKNIRIKNRSLGRTLADALENAKNKSSKPVKFQRPVVNVQREDIKKMFGDKN